MVRPRRTLRLLRQKGYDRMKKKHSIRINVLVIVLSLLIIRCSQPTNSPTLSLPSSTSIQSTITPVSTLTKSNPPELNARTSTPMPTLAATVTASLTPLATLDPGAVQLAIARLMATNDDCFGVCFWGIIPGSTHFDQAARVLDTFKPNGVRENKDGSKSYNKTFTYRDEAIYVSLIFQEANGLIPSISITIDGTQHPSVLGKDWQAFRPDSILKEHGVPKEDILS